MDTILYFASDKDTEKSFQYLTAWQALLLLAKLFKKNFMNVFKEISILQIFQIFQSVTQVTNNLKISSMTYVTPRPK